MPQLTGGQAIIKSLEQRGVKTFFGLPGGQLYYLFDALNQASKSINLINSRHEQGVGYMAYGYAKSTGSVGVYTVVPGPGVLNSASALCTAYSTNTPVLCIAGQIPSQWIGKGAGLLHEIPDQLGVLRSLTKYAQRIEKPAEAPNLIQEAYTELLTGRPRPVALEMAEDILGVKEEVALLDPIAEYESLAPDPDLIKDSAKLLGSAKNPLIVVGSGAMDAGKEIIEIAEMLQAPVTTLWSGKGVIDERHYLSQSNPAGHKLWSKADVILAVGTRLSIPRIHWGIDTHLKIIHIDIDNEELNRLGDPDIGILGDAQVSISKLINTLPEYNHNRPSRKDELLSLKKGMLKEFEENIGPQLEILNVIREELPEDGFFVDEVTQVGFASWYAFPCYHPRHFITSGYQGNLGYGYATALGVKAAHPDKKVISISGDGGFMYQAQELATAVKYGLDVVAIIFNNNLYGNVQNDLELMFEGQSIGAELHNPDFVKFAESFGAMGFKASNPTELRSAIKKAFAESGPTLIEMTVGKMPRPWPYINLPKCRG